MKPRAILTDKELEGSIANMLRFGVTLSAAVVLVGGVLTLARRSGLASGHVPDYAHFAGESSSLRTGVGILRGAAHFDGGSIVMLGILLLIATPIFRVAFCVVGFARQRDKLYVAISATVLAILIYSLIRGGF